MILFLSEHLLFWVSQIDDSEGLVRVSLADLYVGVR